jgi:acyl carrier protein
MSRTRDLNDQFRQFILKQFPFARHNTFGDEDSLLERGIIDSMGVLEVIVFMEKTFGITVSDEELTPQNFQSINSLSAYLMSKNRDDV